MHTYTTALSPAQDGPLDTAIALLVKHRHEDYYAYEHEGTWHLGLGSHASLVVSPDGKTATKVGPDAQQVSSHVTESLNDVARAFAAEYSALGKIFGHVGFNYSAIVSGQPFNPSRWPILSLLVPRVHVSISSDRVTVTSGLDDDARAIDNFINSSILAGTTPPVSNAFIHVDVQTDEDNYASRVSRAIAEIRDGKYSKVIPSRIVNLSERVDMLATLYHGRRANTPARSFTLRHTGIEATGFSPEVLLSIKGQNVFTDAVAGTKLAERSEAESAYKSLLGDPKEMMEHMIAIQSSVKLLSQICSRESIAIRDFASPMPRGNVCHLFSLVTGTLARAKDGWDALPGLGASITVPALPGQEHTKAINAFEPYPRDMYFGAVIMIDPAENFFEATLVLRTVFQDHERQWLQAGAGVTTLSTPEREFTETCEKLGSIYPHLVAATTAR
ncbi:Salicylate synthase [Purpureocillium lavendulum]|uniref:Salicylate synthase n=1 Tax=Purpureocillium lavendulum TaxID=1247861 RepID=A0AB34FK07_9HYPO|nr:Salicylate synthase [Purpureocillium lavendulum]